jgi:hypothetical protein
MKPVMLRALALAAAGALGTGLVGLLGSAPASAAPGAGPTADIAVSAGIAHLTPQPGGGYAGQLPVTLRYTGPANPGVVVTLMLPSGVDLAGGFDSRLATCMRTPPGRQLGWRCEVRGAIVNGSNPITVGLTSLAAPATRARRTESATIRADLQNNLTPVPDPTPGNNSARYHAVLAGTGRGVDPHVWRAAAEPDLAIQASDATSAPIGDGTYAATLTLTVSSRTATTYDLARVSLTNPPAGLQYIESLDPVVPCLGGSCSYNPLIQGSQQKITMRVRTSQPLPSGTPLTFTIGAVRSIDVLPDGNPSDNTATSHVK